MRGTLDFTTFSYSHRQSNLSNRSINVLAIVFRTAYEQMALVIQTDILTCKCIIISNPTQYRALVCKQKHISNLWYVQQGLGSVDDVLLTVLLCQYVYAPSIFQQQRLGQDWFCLSMCVPFKLPASTFMKYNERPICIHRYTCVRYKNNYLLHVKYSSVSSMLNHFYLPHMNIWDHFTNMVIPVWVM